VDSNRSWQSYAASTNTWLDRDTFDAIRTVLPTLADEVVSAIQREVAEYARPLSGEFGHGIRSGTELALRRFIGDESAGSPDTYRRLGYGEHRAGRSLNALQSAYRVGARVAWRGMSRAAAAAGADEAVQRNLAEAMFAYIDQLAAESIDGYADAQLEDAGERERQRARLCAALLSSPQVDGPALAAAAARARWPLPRTLACVLIAGKLAGQASRRIGGDTLSSELGDAICVVVPNPATLEREARALADRLRVAIALGPVVGVADASTSLRWAQLARELAGEGVGLVVAEERLTDLVMLLAADALAAIRERALSPLASESSKSRARLEETLMAWLRHRGSQRAIANELEIHPQTVRYRLRRLRELFGSAVDDPERRFELELALRAPSARGVGSTPP
jgi:hypothetical protein